MLGAYLRLYHIEFGLPHSFHADEPEIAELAIKYTFEIKDILAKNEFYRLTPISYVYGTFPAYLFTFFTMIYSKGSNLLSFSFEKTDIYVFLRSVNALLSLLLIPVTAAIYKNLLQKEEKTKVGMLLTVFLTALNWKLILHAHYLNVDIIVTLALTASYLTFLKYLDSENDTKYTILSAIFFGIAVGTKVTVLLTIPLYLAGFLYKKELKNLLAFIFLVLGTFILTNPFSLVFANDFAFRVYTLSVKENGLVFDSVDSNFFKYVVGLSHITTPLVTILTVLGMLYFISKIIDYYKNTNTKKKSMQGNEVFKHIFLMGTFLIYMLFFSTGTRRVDRWLLPTLPILFVYASFVINRFYLSDKKTTFYAFLGILIISYMYFPILLLTQFQRQTPKSAAYLWMRDNLSQAANKLVITEEGLDPMNKLQSTYVLNYQVYESQNAQFRMPEPAEGYDYVVMASRPMENFKRPEVKNKFPFYYQAWNSFENTVLDEKKFRLIKSFELTKPNLIEVSDIYIFESVVPVAR